MAALSACCIARCAIFYRRTADESREENYSPYRKILTLRIPVFTPLKRREESFAEDRDWYLRSQYGIEGENYTMGNGTVVPNTDLLSWRRRYDRHIRYSSGID